MHDVDHNWAWVVLAATFVSNVVAVGMSFSYGVMYTDFMDRLDTSGFRTSVVAALTFGSFCFIGPVAFVLTSKIGYRLVTILGSLTKAVGLLISIFSKNMFYMYFTMGILGGIGGGLIFVATFVAIREYFSKRLRVAMVLFWVSVPVGLFLFALLTRAFLNSVAYYGTFFLLSGFTFQGVVCGCLLRPLCHTDGGQYQQIDDDGTTASVHDRPDMNIQYKDETDEEETGLKINQHTTYKAFEPITDVIEVSIDQTTWEFQSRSWDGGEEIVTTSQPETVRKPKAKGAEPVEDEPKDTSPDTHEEFKAEPESVSDGLGLSNICSCIHALFLIVIFLFCTGFGIPFVFIVDHARLHGHSDMQAACILASIGIFYAIGVVFLEGVFHVTQSTSSRRNVAFLTVTLILGAGSLLLMDFITTITLMVFIAFVFGVVTASMSNIRHTFLSGIVDPDLLTRSLGLGSLVAGLGFLLGSPIAGYLFDLSTTYFNSFLMAVICLAASAVFTIPVLVIYKPHERL